MTAAHEAFREFDVTDNGDVLSSGEIRYRFTVTKGIPARTWASAADGFHPAEGPAVDIQEVAIRHHQSHPWQILTGAAFDAFTADVPDTWFFAQLEAENA